MPTGGGIRARVLVVMGGLAAVNLLLWALAALVFRHYPVLIGTAFLAYGFGLRHAVDADHIAAIDNVTRKLMQTGARPVAVGLFFSLGHSTIVFSLSAGVAMTTLALKQRFGVFAAFGSVAGTLISALFLLAIAAMNVAVLAGILKTFRRVQAGGVYADEDFNLLLGRRGFFGRVFRGLFRLVQKSWQMYLVGLLFGLGFDTATEVGLLGISAAEACRGLPVWSIMMFPALFAAGMALVDTADGVLMLGSYGWAFSRPLRKLYYNIIVTAVSVVVAVLIGGLEALGLVQGAFSFSGVFWRGVAALNGDFGSLGYLIIGIFALTWAAAVAVYRLKGYDEIDVRVSGP